jgi:regulatory protein
MNDKELYQRAHTAALRFLSYRPRSEAEVRTRLTRNFPRDLVENVLQALREESLVDDAAFATLWTDSRDSLKPRSAWAIKRELIAKGVDGVLAEEAVIGLDDEASAYRAGVGLARRLHDADLSTFRRRLWSHLKRRGFADADCRHTINRLWEERDADGDRQR